MGKGLLWEWIKLAVLALSIAFVAYFALTLYFWSDALKDYFFFTNEWENYLLLTLIVFAALFVIKGLLKWEGKAFFGGRN